MKLTKKLQAEILKIYHAYWDAYLAGDMKTFASMLDDNVKVFGTAVSEVFNNKTEALRFYKATADQMAGKAEFRNRKIKMHIVDDIVLIHEQNDLFVLIENEWVFYSPVRVSGMFVSTPKGWKLAYQHGSFPDNRAEEGEQIAPEKIKKENLELREAIKRRTVELENKNRELEIEASLEKVRTIAMAMREPVDMLDVCKTITLQLQSLGVKDIRNVQTAIIYESKSIYINYEYYAKHKKQLITEVDFKSHNYQKLFVNNMLKGSGQIFTKTLKGKKVKDWYEHQKTTNQFADRYLATAKSVSYYFFSLGPLALGISTYSPLSEEELSLFKRFRNVFELAYQRYLDIEQAIAQAREAQIEAALERVRARTMAMQQSDELSDTAAVLFQEIKKISNEELIQLTIGNYNEAAGLMEFRVTSWAGEGEHEKRAFNLSIEEPTLLKPAFKAWKQKKKSIVFDLTGEKLKGWLKYRNENTGVKVRSADTKGRRVITVAFFSKGHISLSSPLPLSAETIQLLERFAIVFDGTYTRFLDLQKAEEQTKEAEIQLALERVRAKSLAMHQTSELQEVVNEVAQRLLQMKIDMDGGVIIIINDEVNKDVPLWGAAGAAHYIQKATVPYLDNPIITRMISAIKKRESFLIERYTKQEKDKFMQHLFRHHPWKKVARERKQELLSREGGYCRSMSISRHTSIAIINHHGREFSEADNKILRRFGNVLEQSYTRFLDLKNAEAQAREAKIEAALERIRAAAMAMRDSSALSGIIYKLYGELTNLDAKLDRCFIMIVNPENQGITWWMAGQEGLLAENGFFVQMNQHASHLMYLNYCKKRKKKWTYLFEGKEKKDWDRFGFSKTELAKLPEPIKAFMASAKKVHLSGSSDQFGSLVTGSFEPLPDEQQEIISRFSVVFNQAYIRFLDLQKAEAQAKEAQIEAALERVRAGTMAMQHSDELRNVVFTIYEQLKQLNFNAHACNIVIADKSTGDREFWVAGFTQDLYPESYKVPYINHPYVNDQLNAWKQGEQYAVFEYSGQMKKDFDKMFFTETDFKNVPPDAKRMMMGSPSVTFSTAFFSHGSIQALGNRALSAENADILKRFAKVFEQTYTRFLDLQKAEAQNKIIQIENERKTRELEEARELQLAMLPKDIPQLRDFEIAVFMKTATEVGGDYYDFSFMHNGSINIAIGDATGHGMKAGTMVTMIKSLFVVNSSSKEMTEFFKLTNDAIKNSNLKRMMVGFAMMNIYGNKLKVLNSGMPPVYYYKNALNEIVEIGGHNLPLGAMNKSKYTADEIDMNRGDAILMLSDGLPELPNDKNEQYGYKKLVDIFLLAGRRSADEIINVLKNEISNWGGNKELEDDITFVVIKLK